MKYKNNKCRKMRKSHILFVSCGHCKEGIAKYQKVGRGNLLRMHVERIIKGSIDFSKQPEKLYCPNCQALIATKISPRGEENASYRMLRGAYNTKEDF